MLLGLLLSALIVGGVFTFIKPRLDSLITGAIPQVQTNRFVALVVTGILALTSLWVANQIARLLRVGR